MKIGYIAVGLAGFVQIAHNLPFVFMDITLLLMPFAVWRLTSLLVSESGPYEIFDKFRYAVGIRYDEHARMYGENVVAEALSCFWCSSIWVSFATVVLYAIIPKVSFWVMLPFAVSGAAILLEQGTTNG